MNQQEYIEFHEGFCSMAVSREGTLSQEPASVQAEAIGRRFAKLCANTLDQGNGFPLTVSAVLMIFAASSIAGCPDVASRLAFCERGRQLSIRKNTDYADPGTSEDPFAIFKNFLRCEALGVCSVEAGFLVRLSDKVSRCVNLLARSTGPAVEDEKLADTLLDIVNYTCLLLAYIQTKKEQGK